ncbi:MAG TPA: hypothetical protein VI216_04665 [Candidatus Acidoferrales bacterium]
MKTRAVLLSLAVLLAATVVPAAQAQRQFTFARTSGNRAGPPFSRRIGMAPPFVRQHRMRRNFPSSLYFWPYFYPDYDYGYDSESQIIETPPPQIIEQVAQPAPAPVAPAPDSVVIELQGDHWVRVTNYGQSQIDGQTGQPESARAANSETATARRAEASEPPRELPAAVLIFRDGHREEIGKYVVVGATLYTSADYWSSGSWTRRVQLSALDVPATLKLNQDRDTRFTLPSGPNEVMVRP